MAQLSKICIYNGDIDVKEYLNGSYTYSIYKERPLKNYQLHLSRQHNQLEPTSISYCESVEIEMDAPEPSEIYLQAWFMQQETMDIVISTDVEIARGDAKNSKHEIICKNAQCYSIEDFIINENTHDAKRRIRIFFEAKSVTVAHNKIEVATYMHL